VQYAESEAFTEQRNEVLHLVKHIDEMTMAEVMENVKLFAGKKDVADEYLDMILLWYRDVLLYKATKDAGSLLFKDELEAVAAQAGKRSFENLQGITEALEQVKQRMKSNVNFEKLYDDYCNSTWATLGSDKSYLSLDTNPYDYDDGDYRYSSTVLDAVKKIHKALNLPDSLYEDMMQTSWGMGKQEETFDSVGVKVTWTYHPDKGMEVTYKIISN
jgi:hypothetical protein